MYINQRLLNSLEGCPFPKQAGLPGTTLWCEAPGWADGKQARHTWVQPMPSSPGSANLPDSWADDRVPWAFSTHPLPPRETRELLIQALVGMSRGWANAQHVNPLKMEGTRQPGAPRALCPATAP